MSSPALVVKVGGSLFDLPDLGPRLRSWLSTLPADVLLVPGGGPTSDVIRRLDQCHHLGEESAHWLALRSLGLNAHVLASLLPDCRVIGDWDDNGEESGLAILDPLEFAIADECRPGRLPHHWNVTSDSLAARVAIVLGAPLLILLKSVTIPDGTDWAEAGRRGWVDPFFGEVVGPSLTVRAVNFREWCP